MTPWTIHFVVLADDSAPGEAFLDACPVAVRARFQAVLEVVRDAPPPQFSGGGFWEAMHGSMKGFYEIRIDHERTHYRLFCKLVRQPVPRLLIVDGRTKAFGTKLSEREYAAVRDVYAARRP